VFGQGVGWLVQAVIKAAADYRLIRVAVQERCDHFLANPGQDLAAPEGTGPALYEAQPHGVAFPVPMETHLDIELLDVLFAVESDRGGALEPHTSCQVCSFPIFLISERIDRTASAFSP